MNTSVLIVDGHEIVRLGLRSLLGKQKGLRIVGETGSGKHALLLAEKLQPDIVIMDRTISDMDGMSFIRELRDRVPEARPILFSACTDHSEIRDALGAGGWAFVPKGNSAADLLEAISTVLAGRPYVAGEWRQMLIGWDGSRRAQGRGALTAREKEVLVLWAKGRSLKETAATLHVCTDTVKTHRRAIRRKLRLSSTVDVVRYAIRNKIVCM